MITKEETFNDLVRGADSEAEFTIDTDSSVIFDILRNKMYSDKIGAVAREIASNSRDANREAGVDKPAVVEIISPHKALSMGHLSISFKDYGLGMNPEKVINVFLKYGASDKRNTNKLTGGFGLGSKSVFAYNDTFTVITICDYQGKRMKYTYTAMLDSSGKGKLVLFDSKETDEETGTNIIVPLRDDLDRYTFERRVMKYTSTWGNEIEYKNFYNAPDEKEVVYSDDNFDIYEIKEKYGDSDMELLVDGIPYPLNTYDLNIKDIFRNSDFKFILKFNTGDLTLSASRESVQYDEDTVEAIENKYEECLKTLNKLVKNHIKNSETYLEACTRYFYFTRAIKDLKEIPPYDKVLGIYAKEVRHEIEDVWQGLKLVDKFVFKHHTVTKVTIDKGKNKYTSTRLFFFNDPKALILYGDTRKNANRNINIWNEGYSEFYIVKPDKKDDSEGINEFMDFIFKFDIDFNLYSDYKIVKRKVERVKTTKKDYVRINTRDVNNLPRTVHMNRKTFLNESNSYDFSNTLYRIVDSLSDGFYSDVDKLRFLERRGYDVMVIRKQDYINWFSKTKARCFTEVYDKEYEKFEEETIKTKVQIYKNYMLNNIINDYVQSCYREVVDEILPEYAQGLYDNEWYLTYGERKIVKDKLKFDFGGFRNKIKYIFEEEYGMFTLLKWTHHMTEKEKETIKNYIKTVNQCK